jgi:hypothetical protein
MQKDTAAERVKAVPLIRPMYRGNMNKWEPKTGARPAAATPDTRRKRDRAVSRLRVTPNSSHVKRSQGIDRTRCTGKSHNITIRRKKSRSVIFMSCKAIKPLKVGKKLQSPGVLFCPLPALDFPQGA